MKLTIKMFYSILSLSYHYFIYGLFLLVPDFKNSNNLVPDFKISNNLVSLSHASFSVLSCISFYLTYDDNIFFICKHFSTGYFLYDLFFMLNNRKLNFFYYCMIYHHIISIYGLHIKGNYYQIELLFWGELSNIPSYFVYNELYTKGNYLEFWKDIQLLLYSCIRIPVIGYFFLLNVLYGDTILISVAMFPVYLMGIGWTTLLYRKKMGFKNEYLNNFIPIKCLEQLTLSQILLTVRNLILGWMRVGID
jgi:hypothetical protein